MMKLEKKKINSSTIIKQILAMVFLIQLFHIVGVVSIILFNQKWFPSHEANLTLGEHHFHITNKGCVTIWPCHLHLKHLKAKEKLWKLKYFTMQKYT